MTETNLKKEMFEFYLTIIESLAQTQNPAFLAKFNNMIYADNKLNSDEKFFLMGEMQKRWQKCTAKTAAPKMSAYAN
jgi:hypothetical protein